MSYFARSSEMPEWTAQVPNSWDNNWLKWSVDLSTKRPTEEEQKVLSIHLQRGYCVLDWRTSDWGARTS